jgi:hypothetical protein
MRTRRKAKQTQFYKVDLSCELPFSDDYSYSDHDVGQFDAEDANFNDVNVYLQYKYDNHAYSDDTTSTHSSVNEKVKSQDDYDSSFIASSDEGNKTDWSDKTYKPPTDASSDSDASDVTLVDSIAISESSSFSSDEDKEK